MANCGIQAAGWVLLSDALGENGALERLRLDRNAIAGRGKKNSTRIQHSDDPAKAKNAHLFASLAQRGVLRTLVAPNLAKNTALQHLSLAETSIGDGMVVELCKHLRKNGTLRALVLHSNFITDEGALALAELLAGGVCAMQSLDLSLNHVGERGGAALAAALARNRTLLALLLNDNQLGQEAAEALLRVA